MKIAEAAKECPNHAKLIAFLDQHPDEVYRAGELKTVLGIEQSRVRDYCPIAYRHKAKTNVAWYGCPRAIAAYRKMIGS